MGAQTSANFFLGLVIGRQAKRGSDQAHRRGNPDLQVAWLSAILVHESLIQLGAISGSIANLRKYSALNDVCWLLHIRARLGAQCKYLGTR